MSAPIPPDATAARLPPTRPPPTRPVVGIGVVIWRGSRVLLIRRAHPPRAGEWSLPGGHQELGETVFEAAVREAREETALHIVPQGIITVVDSIARDDGGAIRHHFTLVEILADGPEGEAVAGDDAAAVRWTDLAEIDDLVAWSETRRVIRLAAALRQTQHIRAETAP